MEKMEWDGVRFITSWIDLKRLAFVAAWAVILRDNTDRLYGENAHIVLIGCFAYILCYIFYKAIVDRIRNLKKLSILGNEAHMHGEGKNDA